MEAELFAGGWPSVALGFNPVRTSPAKKKKETTMLFFAARQPSRPREQHASAQAAPSFQAASPNTLGRGWSSSAPQS